MERKLTAILCADIVGFSRLTGEDEEATLRYDRPLRDVFSVQGRARAENRNHYGPAAGFVGQDRAPKA